MDSESVGQAWVEDLRHRFSTFCSEADDIICQDSVKYVRTQLITAGENLKKLCSELVEDVLHNFSVDSTGENGLAFPTQEQDVIFPAQKMLSMGIETDQDAKSCAMNSVSTVLPTEPVGERCSDIQFDEKDEVSDRLGKRTLDGDECDVHAYSSTSAQPPAASSSEKAKEMCTRQFSITESEQPCRRQKLEESIIMVNSDECYSDSDMETNYLSLENAKAKLCMLKKKIDSESSFESASQGIYSATDRMTQKCCKELPCAKDWTMVNEEICDWEVI